MVISLGSAFRVWPRVAIALAVWSRAADLEEAVYYSREKVRREPFIKYFLVVLRVSSPTLKRKRGKEAQPSASGRGRGNTGSTKNVDMADKDVLNGSNAYQSSSVGAVNAEQSDGGADILGRGGIGAQTVEGRAGDGELLGGAQAGAGDTSGHHRENWL
jgi:hypothetical protein